MACMAHVHPPAVQERAIVGRLGLSLSKSLNVGLLVAALFHILELGEFAASHKD